MRYESAVSIAHESEQFPLLLLRCPVEQLQQRRLGRQHAELGEEGVDVEVQVGEVRAAN